MHFPVMLGECLDYLAIRADGIYLDTTAGMGGHLGAIAARLTTGFVIGNDRDADALGIAKRNTAERADRIRYEHRSFGRLSLDVRAERVAVNDEQGELERLRENAPDLIKSGGRFVVISFTSLEDRKTKQSFQALARAGRATLLTKHVVRPAPEETEINPPSRSAKLRALEMKLAEIDK